MSEQQKLIHLYWVVTLQWNTGRGATTTTRSGNATYPADVTREFVTTEVLTAACQNAGAPSNPVVLFLSIERNDFGS